MRRTFHALLGLALLLAPLPACGEGVWGGEITLTVSAPGVTPGAAVALADPDWELVVDRACLSVEAMAVATEQTAEGSGEDCFCHGDPPECHGDCSGGASAGTTFDTLEVHRVVDLLDPGAQAPPTLGLFTGDYRGLRLVLSPPHGDAHGDPLPLPLGCGGAEGSLLHLSGTLRHTRGATAIPLRVDLLDLEITTETLDASPALTLEDGEPAAVTVGLDLPHLLEHLDVGPLVSGNPAEVVIGGAEGAHPEAATALTHALEEAALWAVTQP